MDTTTRQDCPSFFFGLTEDTISIDRSTMNFQSWSCCCNTANVGSSVVSADSGHPCHLERQRPINPYHLLRLRKDATERELVYSYQPLAILHHPVRANGDPHMFRAVAAAFETLHNKKTRTAMDRILKKSGSLGSMKQSHNSSELAVERGKSDRIVSQTRKHHKSTGTNDATEHRQEQEDHRYRCISPQQQNNNMCSSPVEEEYDRSNLQPNGPFYLMLKARHFEPFTDPYEVFASVFGSSLGANREYAYNDDDFAAEGEPGAFISATSVSHNHWEFMDHPAVVTDTNVNEGWSSICCSFPTG